MIYFFIDAARLRSQPGIAPRCVIRIAAVAGIEPGGAVDFIGCNNESMALCGLSPTPATIDIRPAVIARTAIDILLHRITTTADAPDAFYTITYVAPAVIEFN